MREGMSLEEELVAALLQKGYYVTTAESCTGGMIAATLINAAGASGVYREGYITYSNESKQKLLGVEREVLERYGAVSRQTAEQMASGAARAAATQAALSSTGIAGPDGGTDIKPVGLVYIGCFLNGKVTTEKHIFQGDRAAIRQQASQQALKLLLKELSLCGEEAEPEC